MGDDSGKLNVSLGITEAQINNAIAVAVTEAMTPDRQAAMIRDVVRAHLQMKPSSFGSYDKETILSKVVGDYIRAEAMKAVQERLDTLAPEIHRIVGGALGPSFEASVFEQLRASLARKVVAEIQITAKVAADDPF